MAKTIAIVSNKGGVGKTTTTLNLGHSLLQKGYKVLLIDLDSQANLSLAESIVDPNYHVGKVITGEIPVNKAIVSKALDVLPSHSDLLSYEKQTDTLPRREERLKKALNQLLGNYDFILIDTPPSLGLMTNNALFACDYYLIPVTVEFFSYEGIRKIIHHVDHLELDCTLAGILLTRFHEKQRGKVIQLLASKLRNSPYHVFQTSIRQSVRVIESQLMKKSLVDYDTEATATQDYLKFSDELLNQTT